MRSRIRTRTAEAAREQGRSRNRRHCSGQALVAVLLLHAVGAPRLPASHPIATKRSCAPFSRQPTSVRKTQSGLLGSWSPKGMSQLPDRPRRSQVPALSPLARERSRGHLSIPRSAPARSGHDQVDSQQAHCAGHRLAGSERVEERAESMSARCASSKLTSASTGAPNSGAVGFPPRFARRRPVMQGVGVRRAKARSFSGCESHPATFAPAGSNWSSRGGNEAAEASGVKGGFATLRMCGP